MKRVLVTGAGGFIGHHLSCKLKELEFDVFGCDLKYPIWGSHPGEFHPMDMRKREEVDALFRQAQPEWVFALAADMGGAGYVFSGENDVSIMQNNTRINLYTSTACDRYGVERVFFASSACVYPKHLQTNPDSPALAEHMAWPAAPDSPYGLEKLYAETLYQTYACLGLFEVRIARFHNIYGPMGDWRGGREKVPAAFMRKVAIAKLKNDPKIEIWGDGEQTRSFLYIDDCVTLILRLMSSDYGRSLNIGTDEQVSINQLADVVADVAEVQIVKVHDLTKPQGVRGRNADLTKMREVLVPQPPFPLRKGIARTYRWVEEQVRCVL